MPGVKGLHINTERTWRGGEQQMFYLAQGLFDAGHESLLVCQPGRPAYARAQEARSHDIIQPPTSRARSLAV